MIVRTECLSARGKTTVGINMLTGPSGPAFPRREIQLSREACYSAFGYATGRFDGEPTVANLRAMLSAEVTLILMHITEGFSALKRDLILSGIDLPGGDGTFMAIETVGPAGA